MSKDAYKGFISRFMLLINKRPDLIVNTLENIFTMRLIGNKTHGDLAEIAISEFINQYMYDFHSEHVGKDLYRAKTKEEDIKIYNEITKESFPVSLKAYGNGPLQLSTDKESKVFPYLKNLNLPISNKATIKRIFQAPELSDFVNGNVLPLIYDEVKSNCNIMVFDMDKAINNIAEISLIESGRGRKHPIIKFCDSAGGYVCEVRYGGASANALQRGVWTHTKHAVNFFVSLTNGWVNYSNNKTLVRLFSHSLVARKKAHAQALSIIKEDIGEFKDG